MTGRLIEHFLGLDFRSVIVLLDHSDYAQLLELAPHHYPAAAAHAPEPGHLVPGSHSVLALVQGGLQMPEKGRTGQGGSEGLQRLRWGLGLLCGTLGAVVIGTEWDRGVGTGEAVVG